jgi:hypothetical protein
MKKIITLAILALGASLMQAQNINTIAGNGVAAFSGDGGQATAAELNTPSGVAVDASGNIFIADQYNNRIRKVTPGGVISTVVGNGTAGYTGDGGAATAAELDRPCAITLDKSGNMYIADYINNCVREVTAAGIISTIAGNGVGGGGLGGDGGPATAATISLPGGVAVDNHGNLYIGQYYNSIIRKVNTSGIISTVAGNGTAGYSGDGGQATAAELNSCSTLWVDTLGNMYISDDLNNRIRKVNTSGIISTIAGNGTAGFSGDGGPATAAELDRSDAVVFDVAGNMYISEENNSRIRKVNPAGIISTYAGNGTAGFSGDGGPATAAELNYPVITVDAAGDIFVADRSNNRVRKINSILGVNEISETNNSINVYPNPSNGSFTIALNGAGYKSMTVYDVTGKALFTKLLNEERTINMDMSSYANGIYFAQFVTDNGIMNKKVVVQK